MIEKWNLKTELKSLTPEEKMPEWMPQAVAEDLEMPIKNLKEYEKTEEEKEIISNIQHVLNDILNELDLSPIALKENDVHVLAPEDYEACQKLRGEGMTLYGHVYVQRRNDTSRMIHELAHEMLHAASFTSILHRYWNEYREGKETHNLTVADRRSGFELMKTGKRLFAGKKFEGLNEGVIELLAMKIRERVQKEKDKERLSYAYPHALLIDEIIEHLSAAEGTDSLWHKRLYHDLFTGSYSSLKDMGRAWRKTHEESLVPLLSRMDNTDASAIKTAEALGLNDLATHIKGIAETSEERLV